ncbi:MAG: lipopolysaccharide heptosyltransferase II [Candidatus Sumerlaeota bacterium]
MTDPKRIFVRAPNWVGDAVMATPFLRILRRTFPQAHITVGARGIIGTVFENNPDIDERWKLGDRELKIFSAAREARRRHFDLGFLLPNSFRAALMLRLAGIARRVGFKTDGRNFLLTDRVEATPGTLSGHLVDYYTSLLAEFTDLDAQPRELVLIPAPDAVADSKALLEKHGISDRRLVGICPGAAFGTAKRWTPEGFARVADHVSEKYNARPVIVGAPNESDVMNEVAGLAQCETTVLDRDYPLRTMIAMMSRFEVFVTNDCGAMHVAAGRGAPIVAIFGPTHDENTAPYHPRAKVIRASSLDCADNPCGRRHCPKEHECMRKVEADTVCAAVDAQMEHTAPEGAIEIPISSPKASSKK